MSAAVVVDRFPVAPAGPDGRRRRRPATAAAAGGTLLLVVAVLSIIWPALAVLVLAGAGAVLLVRGGLHWAAAMLGLPDSRYPRPVTSSSNAGSNDRNP